MHFKLAATLLLSSVALATASGNEKRYAALAAPTQAPSKRTADFAVARINRRNDLEVSGLLKRQAPSESQARSAVQTFLNSPEANGPCSTDCSTPRSGFSTCGGNISCECDADLVDDISDCAACVYLEDSVTLAEGNVIIEAYNSWVDVCVAAGEGIVTGTESISGGSGGGGGSFSTSAAGVSSTTSSSGASTTRSSSSGNTSFTLVSSTSSSASSSTSSTSPTQSGNDNQTDAATGLSAAGSWIAALLVAFTAALAF